MEFLYFLFLERNEYLPFMANDALTFIESIKNKKIFYGLLLFRNSKITKAAKKQAIKPILIRYRRQLVSIGIR